jgi:hypothetical protein
MVLLNLSMNLSMISIEIGVMDVDCAGQMGFFLFLAGRGFFPRHVAESCVRAQAGKWLIVACVLLEWLVRSAALEHKLVRVSALMDAMNYLAGTVKSQLITYGSYVIWNRVI